MTGSPRLDAARVGLPGAACQPALPLRDVGQPGHEVGAAAVADVTVGHGGRDVRIEQAFVVGEAVGPQLVGQFLGSVSV